MVVSGRGFLPIEGGSAPIQFVETIARRVGFGKKIILGDKKKENADAIAKIMNDAGKLNALSFIRNAQSR